MRWVRRLSVSIALVGFSCSGQPADSIEKPPEPRPAEDRSKWKAAYRYRLKSRLDADELVEGGADGIEFQIVTCETKPDASSRDAEYSVKVTNRRDESVWYQANSIRGPSFRGAFWDGESWLRCGTGPQYSSLGSHFLFRELKPGDSVSKTVVADMSRGPVRFSLYFSDHPHVSDATCSCNYFNFREFWTVEVRARLDPEAGPSSDAPARSSRGL